MCEIGSKIINRHWNDVTDIVLVTICLLWTDFTLCSDAFTVGFEEVDASWVIAVSLRLFTDYYVLIIILKWCWKFWAKFLVSVLRFQGIVILFEKLSWKFGFPLGLFAYLSGNMLIIEDLCNGRQKFLSNQNEELSTMALQNDGQVIAAASCQNSRKKSESLISIWNLSTCSCDKVSDFFRLAKICYEKILKNH